MKILLFMVVVSAFFVHAADVGSNCITAQTIRQLRKTSVDEWPQEFVDSIRSSMRKSGEQLDEILFQSTLQRIVQWPDQDLLKFGSKEFLGRVRLFEEAEKKLRESQKALHRASVQGRFVDSWGEKEQRAFRRKYSRASQEYHKRLALREMYLKRLNLPNSTG